MCKEVYSVLKVLSPTFYYDFFLTHQTVKRSFQWVLMQSTLEHGLVLHGSACVYVFLSKYSKYIFLMIFLIILCFL